MRRFSPVLIVPLLCRVTSFVPSLSPVLHLRRHRGCDGDSDNGDALASGRRIAARASVRDKDFDFEGARRQLEALLEMGSKPSPEPSAEDWLASRPSPPALSPSSEGLLISPDFLSSESEGDPLAVLLATVATAAARAKREEDGAACAPVAASALDGLLSDSVLTSTDRARRIAEIKLLAQLSREPEPRRFGSYDKNQVQDAALRYHDRVVSELWSLWLHERGPQAASKLLKTEELVAQGPEKWDTAEAMLKALVREYGASWAEPVNRLATLYFLQRKFRLAELLCLAVLAVKPWHVGALSGMVLVYEGLHDPESAAMWAARRLPPYSSSGSNKRRAAWVEQAVNAAGRSLLDAERRVTLAFGRPDHHATGKSRRRLRREKRHGPAFPDDAWQ
jgi:hypothetical protein